MGFFSGQLANVVEWEEFRDDMIFWKWSNREIKKGSKLIIRPGQDAIFLHNGRIEGIFQDDGEYDIESQIIPFLSTLKGFKFGFNSGMRPGGLPIRANGTFTFKVNDYIALIDKVAGVKESYYVEDVKQRITSILDQLLMKWIAKEGKDMFNLMANSFDISNGIKSDLDMQIYDIGITITAFNIMSFNYPENVQSMINKNAEQSMIGDMNRYQQVSMVDGIASGKVQGGGVASDMTGMMMGMTMANQMMQNVNAAMQQNQTSMPAQQNSAPNQTAGAKPNFCPNCGQKTGEANFCPNCGQKLI